MEKTIKKRQSINTLRVYTANNQVYITKGRERRFPVPLRWIPVPLDS